MKDSFFGVLHGQGEDDPLLYRVQGRIERWF